MGLRVNAFAVKRIDEPDRWRHVGTGWPVISNAGPESTGLLPTGYNGVQPVMRCRLRRRLRLHRPCGRDGEARPALIQLSGFQGPLLFALYSQLASQLAERICSIECAI
jgi:hypothetical protein